MLDVSLPNEDKDVSSAYDGKNLKLILYYVFIVYHCMNYYAYFLYFILYM